MHPSLMHAFLVPPDAPSSCLFSTLSVNYTADLCTRVEPCVFGGTPNCAECGCSISMGLHWLGNIDVIKPLKARHLIRGSLAVGRSVNRVKHRGQGLRWASNAHLEERSPVDSADLVQIEP